MNLDTGKLRMSLISLGAGELTNIHFLEYPGKEINIPKWNSQLKVTNL
jgi:hypothetical protein